MTSWIIIVSEIVINDPRVYDKRWAGELGGSKIFVNFSRHLEQWSIVGRVIFVAIQPGALWTISLKEKNTLTRNHRRLLKRPVEWQADVRPLNGYTGHLPLLLLICAFSLFSEETHFFVCKSFFSYRSPNQGLKHEDESILFFFVAITDH